MKKVNVLWIIPVLFVLSGCMTGDVSSDEIGRASCRERV